GPGDGGPGHRHHRHHRLDPHPRRAGEPAVSRTEAGQSTRRRAGANAPAPHRARPERGERTTVSRTEAGQSTRRRAGANAPAPHRARPERGERTTVKRLANALLALGFAAPLGAAAALSPAAVEN